MFKFFSTISILLLLSSAAISETILPETVISEVRNASDMQPNDILYVDFWASWCTPCRKSFPWMNEMVEKYSSKGFKALAINLDKDRALADKFLSVIPASFPIFYDPSGQLAKEFQVKAMPSSYIINFEGEIIQAHKGFFENKTASYEQEIQSLFIPISKD